MNILSSIRNIAERLEDPNLDPVAFVRSLTLADVRRLFLPYMDEKPSPAIGKGEPMCPGVASGFVTFKLDQETSFDRILIVDHLTNQHLSRLNQCMGVLSAHEEQGAHAVIVARSMAKPLISNIETMSFSTSGVTLNGQSFQEGDPISFDAFTGDIFKEQAQIIQVDEAVRASVLEILKSVSPVNVHGNADTAAEGQLAKAWGAQGLEPRSEHMFFNANSLPLFKALLLTDVYDKFESLKEKVEHIQYEAFLSLFQVAREGPTIVRLFDPPAHEFLSEDATDVRELAKALNLSSKIVLEEIRKLKELNPMLGCRGARLLLTKPALLNLQLYSLIRAALAYHQHHSDFVLWISIPMVVDVEEIRRIKTLIFSAQKILKAEGLPLKIGTMIETPRAVFLAHEIAKEVDFLSFGTNDLSAQTFAFSRGDCYEKFLRHYLETRLLDIDPFQQLDRCVEEMIQLTVYRARSVNPDIHIGLCGEQGSDPKTVAFCYQLGFNSISCNPNKIPEVLFYACTLIFKSQ